MKERGGSAYMVEKPRQDSLTRCIVSLNLVVATPLLEVIKSKT